MKKTKEQIEAEIAPLKAQLDELRDAEVLKESLTMVGKCFKYRNCYSMPQTEAYYWWYYAKVIGIGEYWPKAFTFQIDKDGKIEIEYKTTFHRMQGYTQIPAREFDAAWRKVQKRIAGMKP